MPARDNTAEGGHQDMRETGWLALAFSLALCGSAVSQTADKTKMPAGSAGEAAGAANPATAGATAQTFGLNPVALGQVVANPGSFQMQPVTRNVDITDAMMRNADTSDD